MSVTIKIHRGTNQIGGSVTEIYTENTHLFIDFGAELPGGGGEITDRKLAEMIRKAKCDGVLFAHYRGTIGRSAAVTDEYDVGEYEIGQKVSNLLYSVEVNENENISYRI